MNVHRRTKLFGLVLIGALVLGLAAGCTTTQAEASSSEDASHSIEITGIVDSIDASSLIVNGQAIALTSSISLDGIAVGDLVKVEVEQASDGSLTTGQR